MVRRVFLAFLVVGLVGCGDDSVGPADVAGTYILLSVNGGALPVAIGEGTDFLLEITAGSTTLNADLTCSQSFELRETDGGTVTTDTLLQPCTYTLDDGFMLTRSGETVALNGSILGTTLTIIDGGLVLVFLM
jgi:hypothetical protein